MEKMRLQKWMALCGVAARRKCELLISEGHVQVNGSLCTQMGVSVDPDVDEVRVDGMLIRAQEEKIYIMLNKPQGVICAVTDPFGRKTVLDCVEGLNARLFPVGRLDYDTEGLILLTNDGAFSQRVLHPSFQVDKTYYTVAIGQVTDEHLAKLQSGVMLEDGITAPAKVRLLQRSPARSILLITIHEGRNRQVRRMMETLGYPVQYLRRDGFGPLKLENLASGEYRALTEQEIRGLGL